jgi:hypothetical protein
VIEMEFQDDVFLGITAVVNVLAIYFALFIAPAEVEMGELVRVFYFHLPQAIVCYLTLVISLVSAALYLRTKQARYDALSESAALLGLLPEDVGGEPREEGLGVGGLQRPGVPHRTVELPVVHNLAVPPPEAE